jgi:hypothetical protein
MSLYRQPGRVATRTLALAAAGALVIGLIGGFALGRLTAAKPTLAEKIAQTRSALRPAEQGIDLVATEYAQAVRGGRVVAPTEYGAAEADVKRVRDTLAAARADLQALNPARAAAFAAAVAALEEGVRTKLGAAEVQRRSDAARQALGAVFGG